MPVLLKSLYHTGKNFPGMNKPLKGKIEREVYKMDKLKLEPLNQEFTAAYSFLYEYGDSTPAFYAAVKDFDEKVKNKRSKFYKTVCAFIEFRRDVISSDREAAAFMIAYTKVFA